MAVDACTAGTTCNRWRVSPSGPPRSRCWHAHATARAAWSLSSTGARTTRGVPSLGGGCARCSGGSSQKSTSGILGAGAVREREWRVREKFGEESPRNYLNRLTPERPNPRRTRAPPSRRPHRPARVRTKVTDRKPCLTPPPPSTPPRCEPGPKQPIRASPTGRSRAHNITLLPRSVPLLPNCMRHRPEH